MISAVSSYRRPTDSTERTIANAPSTFETIDNGKVSGIELRDAAYSAVPQSCGTSAKFVEFRGRSIGEDQQLEILKLLTIGRLFTADAVNQIGNTYFVSRNGKETESFIVQSGYVIQQTNYLSAISGRPRLPNEVVSFSDIDHAPKIALPIPSEVVFSPHVFTNGRTICSYESGYKRESRS